MAWEGNIFQVCRQNLGQDAFHASKHTAKELDSMLTPVFLFFQPHEIFHVHCSHRLKITEYLGRQSC